MPVESLQVRERWQNWISAAPWLSRLSHETEDLRLGIDRICFGAKLPSRFEIPQRHPVDQERLLLLLEWMHEKLHEIQRIPETRQRSHRGSQSDDSEAGEEWEARRLQALLSMGRLSLHVDRDRLVEATLEVPHKRENDRMRQLWSLVCEQTAVHRSLCASGRQPEKLPVSRLLPALSFREAAKRTHKRTCEQVPVRILWT